MRELLLLWLFTFGALLVVAAAAVLAVGVFFGVLRLLWRTLLFLAGMIERAVTRMPPEGVNTDVFETLDAPVSRRMREAGRVRAVRVQAGLVPASACLAQRGAGGMDGRRSPGPRRRDG